MWLIFDESNESLTYSIGSCENSKQHAELNE